MIHFHCKKCLNCFPLTHLKFVVNYGTQIRQAYEDNLQSFDTKPTDIEVKI